jgi:tetratricopeptide (TPR) repeat protein
VLLTLGRQAAEAGRFDDAANYYEEVGKRFQGDSTGLDGYLAAAKLRLARGDYAGGLKALEVAAEQAGARKAEVLSLIASTQMQQKQPLKAKSTAEQVLKLDKTNAAAAAIIAEVQATNSPNEKPDALIALMTNVANQPNAGGDDVAKGLWFTAEILYRNFKAIPFDKVEEKVAALQQLQGVYQQAATMGSNEWTVASLWRIANGIAHIVDVVEATPVPAGLKPADVEEFRSAIKQQSDPLRENAAQAYRSCLDRAEQLEVFSAAVVGCRNKTDTAASPLRDPPAPRAVNLDELQKKAETAQDAQAFEALGIAWLGAFQLKNASVNLTRSMELEDNKASVHSAMGYTLLLQGDPMGARAEYGRALEADPTFDKARLNLAAIKCRYADVEGAKRELSVIKDTAALAGPDVDPEWKACAK